MCWRSPSTMARRYRLRLSRKPRRVCCSFWSIVSTRSITPKGTKIVTEDGSEYDTRRTWFYEITEEVERQSKVARCAKKISYLLYELDKLKGEGTLFKISDDKLIEVCGLLDKIKEVVNDV